MMLKPVNSKKPEEN